jgi:hypothetical protein
MEKKKVYEMVINPEDPESGVYKLSLVEAPAIGEEWIYLSKQHSVVKMKTLSEEKRLIVGPALIPGIRIPRINEETLEEYDITFSEDTVELAAQLYMKRLYNNQTNIEHSQDVSGVSVVESWIISDPEMDKSKSLGLNLPKGTWMTALKVDNDGLWNDYIKSGKVKGISIEALLEYKEVKMSEEDKNLQEIKNLLNEFYSSK